MTAAKVELPRKLHRIFTAPRGAVQYRAAKGGRGSGKSFNFAKMAAIWAYVEPLRVLCVREFQASIAESFHAELKAAIASESWLEAGYDVGRDYLRSHRGGEFIFRGLRRNTQSIKSLAKIDLTIVEEAEDVPEDSWLALEATVFRQPKSELWAIWNPRDKGSPVDNRFVVSPPANAVIEELNWWDNPFFPEGLQTLRQREQERLDQNTYAHVWEGAYLENSDRQVFGGKWAVQEFEPTDGWQGPYQGGDFGFSQDPTAAVRVWLHGDSIYISHEAGKTGLELDHTAQFVEQRIPDFARHVTRWDSARPESISYLKRHGLPHSISVNKWPGSVEDGITFLRSFRQIIVHPRCKETQREMRLYSYKVDKHTGDVTADLLDENNHYIDAIRYAVEPMIKRRSYKVQELAI